MKKTPLLLLLFCAGIATTQAQTRKTFLQSSEILLGPELAIPTGQFRNTFDLYRQSAIQYNYGIGGTVEYLFHINSTYGLSLQTGAISYHSKGSQLNFTSFPVKLGGNFRYHALFAEPQLGFTWFSNNKTIYENRSTTYGINIGGYITHHIALSGNYERWNRGGAAASHAGIRVAYAFMPLKK